MDLKKYLPYALGLIVVYIVYKQLTGNKSKVKVIDNMDVFNYQRWIDIASKNKNIKQLSSGEVISLADKIYKAKSFYNDDEDAVYSVFSSIPYKSMVGQLSVAFQNKYNKPLIQYLDFLSQTEKAKLFGYIQKMSNGY